MLRCLGFFPIAVACNNYVIFHWVFPVLLAISRHDVMTSGFANGKFISVGRILSSL